MLQCLVWMNRCLLSKEVIIPLIIEVKIIPGIWYMGVQDASSVQTPIMKHLQVFLSLSRVLSHDHPSLYSSQVSSRKVKV